MWRRRSESPGSLGTPQISSFRIVRCTYCAGPCPIPCNERLEGTLGTDSKDVNPGIQVVQRAGRPRPPPQRHTAKVRLLLYWQAWVRGRLRARPSAGGSSAAPRPAPTRADHPMGGGSRARAANPAGVFRHPQEASTAQTDEGCMCLTSDCLEEAHKQN